MKAFLDTCVFDWIIDTPQGAELVKHATDGKLTIRVFPEVAKELHDIPEHKAQRRAELLAAVRPSLPVQPTNVPVSGLARSGAARTAPEDAESFREQLVKLGLHKLDVLHLMNARYDRCDVFVTLDKEDILKRRPTLEHLLGFRILTPDELVAELR